MRGSASPRAPGWTSNPRGGTGETPLRAQAGEVVAQGRVDLDSTVGREAWRSFTAGTIGFSFGYIAHGATNRTGGGRHITSLDVFEISATSTPMNNDTRVLSVKAADTGGVRDKAHDPRLGALIPTPKREPVAVKAKAEPGPVKVASFEC